MTAVAIRISTAPPKKKKKIFQLIRRSHVSPPEACSAHTDVAWTVLKPLSIISLSLSSLHEYPVFPS